VALVRLTFRGPSGETSQPSVWVFHGSNGIATELWNYSEAQAEIDRVYSG
jgi:poly(3-hydroxybutyrate) depolymerase